MFWRCGCGHHNFNQHTYCARCGENRPPPPKEEPKTSSIKK
jgi:ribosomal protein L37E